MAIPVEEITYAGFCADAAEARINDSLIRAYTRQVS
jgi:hypothetical protein